ncbi:hypothetical protein ACXYSK_08580 [Streptococcus sp. V919]
MASPPSMVNRFGISNITIANVRAKIGETSPSPPRIVPSTKTGIEKRTGRRINPKPLKNVFTY